MTQHTRPEPPAPGISTRELGQWGEALAAAHLSSNGLAILERNWRCRLGEIDLVCRDETTGQLVIVEVKTRRSTRAGTPAESITYAKLRRLRRLVGQWCAAHPLKARPHGVRLDLVGITLGERIQIHHLKAVG